MKLSCRNASFPHLSDEIAFALIGKLGFEGVDVVIGGPTPRLSLREVRADIPGWAGRVAERLGEQNLLIADIVPWVSPTAMAANHPNQALRDEGRALVRDMAEFASQLGCAGLTVFPGALWNHESHEQSILRAGVELEYRARLANSVGISLSIEAHTGSVCRSPADVLRLCEIAPSVEVTLDVTHFVAGDITLVECDPLLPLTRHVHVRAAAPNRLQTSLRQNTVDYAHLLSALAARRYDGYLALDYVSLDWGGMDEVDVLSETVAHRDALLSLVASNRM